MKLAVQKNFYTTVPKNSLDNYFPFNQWEARKVMRVGQLNRINNTWVNNIRFKKKFLNYFLQDSFYPD